MGAGVTYILVGVIVALVVVIMVTVIYTRLRRQGYPKTSANVNAQTDPRPNESMLCDVTERNTPIRKRAYTSINSEKEEVKTVSYFQEGNERGKITLSTEIKEKVLGLYSTSKKEITHDMFEVADKIGSGNFGNVYKGFFKGLYDDESLTTVAIKSINGKKLNETELENMISEIKIMSNIPPHINIVSMIASCSSQFLEHGDLWLLLEFCQQGDLKQFLMKNKEAILSGAEDDLLNSRCLVTWTYQIASGMQFLAQNQIMHGDLASRNILMGDNTV